ncbi:MAG: hypothetical protein EHM50_07815, partial [Lysobacterales bacterium]
MKGHAATIVVSLCVLGLSFSACGSGSTSNASGSDAGSDANVIECVVSADCEDKNPCTLSECVDNVCEQELAPDGDAEDQTEGDCRKTVCKFGSPQYEIDNGDVPDDDEPCTLDVCSNGLPSSTPKL